MMGNSLKSMRNRKNRLFNWRVKGSLIIMVSLIIGSLILAAILYGTGPEDNIWEIQQTMEQVNGG